MGAVCSLTIVCHHAAYFLIQHQMIKEE